MPYSTDKSNKYIAFLDVLGFKEIVFSNKVAVVDHYFATVHGVIAELNGASIKTIIISDSVILIADDSPDQFRLLLQCISYIQQRMAEEGIWMRGGLSFDEVYYDAKQGIISGKGFIKAYLMEQDALYPRVVIEPAILKHLKLDREQLVYTFNYQKNSSGYIEDEFKLIHDNPGGSRPRYIPRDAMFVSYARNTVLKAHLWMKMGTSQEGNTVLDQLYNKLRTAMYGDQKHYSKYCWLKDFYAEACLDAAAYSGVMPEDTDWIWFQQQHDKFMQL